MPQEQVGGTMSTFGQQALSNKTTEPRTKIGTSLRVEMLAGKAFEDKLLGGTSPGATTRLHSGFGPQHSSRSMSAPGHKIAQRLKDEHDVGKVPTPGPGAYTTASDSVGKQALSQAQTAPFTRVGTAERFARFKDEYLTPLGGTPKSTLGEMPAYSFHGTSRRADIANGLPGLKPTGLDDPGPGAYQSPSALGTQVSSQKQSVPRTRVGTADRGMQRKVYVSREHERESLGKHSPAPNNYSPRQQASSKVKAASSWKFGSGDRFSQVKEDKPERSLSTSSMPRVPGPGSYVV